MQRTDRFGKIARGHNQNVLLMLEFVELCQECVDDLCMVNQFGQIARMNPECRTDTKAVRGFCASHGSGPCSSQGFHFV